ncbi:MAG: PEGA domain-containing protein [Lachnospiraceae bacterium]|nr:PEGA domain-containing protein [Lachnospiraceae bacterium]
MHRKQKKGCRRLMVSACFLFLSCGGWLNGCSAALPQKKSADAAAVATKQQDTPADTGFIPEQTGSYDSADTAVVVSKDEKENKITLFNIPTGRNYTLTYDGTTRISDKYGKEMSMAQVNAGDITDVTFLKNKKKLRSLSMSAQMWKNRAAGNYQINQNGNGLLVAKDQYELADHVMVVSEGKQAELMDINACDSLILQGIDRTIYSITIEKGHGYLKLENAEYFNGGWIEVGQAVIQPVTQDMLLTVPEGKYDVLITNRGNGGTKSVTIARGQETVLDVGDLKGKDPVIGNIVFTVTPTEASVYVDGDKVDISQPVPLEYGIHQLIVRAEGYETMTKYVKVGQPNANIDLELEPSEEEAENQDKEQDGQEVSANDAAYDSVSQNGMEKKENADEAAGTGGADTVNAAGDYRIYITSPKDTEVYFDGKYMGLAPVDFKKEAGTHVVTLRKSGCQTRSFTIQIDSEQKDISWSFSELEKMGD